MAKEADKVKEYSAFVLNKHRYDVGDGVLVQGTGGSKDYIGSIVKIQAPPNDKKNVQLTVRWYYRPEVRHPRHTFVWRSALLSLFR